ncbi:MAG: DoxX family membrane protein [Pseudonocardiaceae bacterium]|nr:DoxX family membrane protein [Pseudonocardiaceae bacterium]
MTANDTPTASATTPGRALNITLWVVQILLAVFFLVAAAAPKLAGQQLAVEMFAQIGAGQWLRYLVGALELAGAIGLLIPRLAGLAALGLAGLMVGAVVTQVFVLGSVVLALTPAFLGVVCCLLVWARWRQAMARAGTLTR